jgi:hypothetical protein
MSPTLIAQLFPTAITLLQEVSKTEAGKNVMEKGRKIIEVAIPSVQKASQLAINFLSTDLTGDSDTNKNVKEITLSKPLDIVNNWLSLPISYKENQFKNINQKISDDLDIVKGQNDILFLSNSISYFIDGHRSRTGIDRGISYALQYDIVAVCNHLEKRRDLRFPGYLLHQFVSLAETVKDLNIFYASVLHDGHVPTYSEAEAKEEMSKSFGIDNRKGEIGMYVPCEMKIRIVRELAKDAPSPAKKSNLLATFKDKVLSAAGVDDISLIANDALYILKDELASNEELEYQIVKKLRILPEKKLLVACPE